MTALSHDVNRPIFYHLALFCTRQQLPGFAPNAMQDQNSADISVNTLTWLSTKCILVCGNLGEQADQVYLSMLRCSVAACLSMLQCF